MLTHNTPIIDIKIRCTNTEIVYLNNYLENVSIKSPDHDKQLMLFIIKERFEQKLLLKKGYTVPLTQRKTLVITPLELIMLRYLWKTCGVSDYMHVIEQMIQEAARKANM